MRAHIARCGNRIVYKGLNRMKQKRYRRRRRKVNRVSRIVRRIRRGGSLRVYLCFVLLVSMICIMAAQLSDGSRFRNWYDSLHHKDVVNKDVQYAMNAGEADADSIEKGELRTRYRNMKFGATDPQEIDPNAPMIAFTFDDGPNSEYTERILKVLQENYSSATFFMVGYNIDKYPETVKNVSLAGCEVANHTKDHQNLTKVDADEILKQIGYVNNMAEELTGSKATMIRPPEGAYDETVLNLLQEPVVLWNLDTEDWRSRNAHEIAQRILDNAKDGDIVLMHDIYDSTAEAVEIVVPMLKERGFQILSVSELARYKGKELELGKAYGQITVDKKEAEEGATEETTQTESNETTEGESSEGDNSAENDNASEGDPAEE